MDRLTKRETEPLSNGEECVICNYEKADCNDSCMYKWCKWSEKALKKLKAYEDKEEQGLLIELPCKVGDEFWVIAYSDQKVTHVRCTGYNVYKDTRNGRKETFLWLDSLENERDYWKLSFDDFKKQCFLTRSEAEEALAKMGE